MQEFYDEASADGLLKTNDSIKLQILSLMIITPRRLTRSHPKYNTWKEAVTGYFGSDHHPDLHMDIRSPEAKRALIEAMKPPEDNEDRLRRLLKVFYSFPPPPPTTVDPAQLSLH